MPSDAADAAGRFVSAFESGDLERIRALFRQDATWWVAGSLPVSGTYTGRDAIVDDFLAAAFPLFASLEFEVTNSVGMGATAIVEWSAKGETATGRAYTNHNAFVIELEDEEIVSVREYLDTESLRTAVFG